VAKLATTNHPRRAGTGGRRVVWNKPPAHASKKIPSPWNTPAGPSPVRPVKGAAAGRQTAPHAPLNRDTAGELSLGASEVLLALAQGASLVYFIPEDTAQAARACFPKGHPLICIAAQLAALYANAQFASLFAPTGPPALDPARLALVTVFQFMAGLTDEQAADAARGHLAWK